MLLTLKHIHIYMYMCFKKHIRNSPNFDSLCFCWINRIDKQIQRIHLTNFSLTKKTFIKSYQKLYTYAVHFLLRWSVKIIREILILLTTNKVNFQMVRFENLLIIYVWYMHIYVYEYNFLKKIRAFAKRSIVIFAGFLLKRLELRNFQSCAILFFLSFTREYYELVQFYFIRTYELGPF